MSKERIGNYVIVGEAGRGGMGIVFHGKDESLDRDVAIKVLPESVASNPDRLSRFTREAKLLAVLNHPNIASIYGFDQDGNRPYVVMEYVEGETLEQKIRNAPVPWRDAVPIAIQIADAIAYAHEHGIIHRDLKPANVKFDQQGTAKVLDFGLAKAFAEVESEANAKPEDSAEGQSGSHDTQSIVDLANAQSAPGSTVPGMMMGTVGYLSPEQARGKGVDKQTDIFSFGCLLFEMLIGKAPFASDSAVDVIGKTLHKDPEWAKLPSDIPPRLRMLLRRCLAKEKKDRLCDIGDARLELAELGEHVDQHAALPPAAATNPIGLKVFAFLAASVAIAFSAMYVLAPEPRSSEPMRSLANRAITVPRNHTILQAQSIADEEAIIMVCVVTPDEMPDAGPGRASYKLVARHRDTDALRDIHTFQGASGYAISPDHESYVLNYGGLILKGRVNSDIDPVELARVEGARQYVVSGIFPAARGIIWLDSDVLVVETLDQDENHSLVMIDAKTGEIKKRTPLKNKGMDIRLDGIIGQFDDEHVMLYGSVYDEEGFSINLVLASLATGELDILIDRAGDAQVIGDKIYFTRGDSIFQAGFDAENHTLLDAGEPVYQGLNADYATHGEFQITENGTLIVLPGGIQGSQRRIMIGNGESVRDLGLPTAPYDFAFDISLDGKKIATTQLRPDGLWEIWGGTIDPPRMRKLIATMESDYTAPLISHDGSQIIAYKATTTPNGSETTRILGSYDQTIPPRELLKLDNSDQNLHTDFHPDGTRYLAHVPDENDPYNTRVIMDIDLETGEQTQLVKRATDSYLGLWSPDGRMMTYINRDRGIPELSVLNPETGESVLVSEEVAGAHAWLEEPDGGYSVLIWSSYTKCFRVSVALGEDGEFVIGETIPEVRNESSEALVYSVDNHGNVYSIEAGITDGEPEHVVVIENWLQNLDAETKKQAD